MKPGLHWCNQWVFDDIFQRVRDAKEKVDQANIDFKNDPTSEHSDLLHWVRVVLSWSLPIEEGFWKQKLNSHWVCKETTALDTFIQ